MKRVNDLIESVRHKGFGERSEAVGRGSLPVPNQAVILYQSRPPWVEGTALIGDSVCLLGVLLPNVAVMPAMNSQIVGCEVVVFRRRASTQNILDSGIGI